MFTNFYPLYSSFPHHAVPGADHNTLARTPIHPGEILADELKEMGFSAKRLADVIEVPPNRLYQLLAGKRNATADTALRLSRYFGMSATFG